MRPRRVVAVAWRDLAQVGAGRSSWRLPALALSLLLPVGALPVPTLPTPPPAPATVRGAAPAALHGTLAVSDDAPLALTPGPPVVATGRRVPQAVRAALDTLPGPTVRRDLRSVPLTLPGRGLLVALVALSLLGGPLAESLPGERQRGTLEPLLTAAVTRGEVVAGKALAWTLAASAVAGLAAASGLLSGASAPGWWLLGVPAALSAAVALGLYSVRHARDVVGGATAPMRLLPVLAVGSALLASVLGERSALLGALVPMGGALWVAGDPGAAAGTATLAAASSVGLALAVGAVTAKALAEATGGRARDPAPGALAVSAAAWVVAAGAGGLWAAASPHGENTAWSDSLLGGALALLLAWLWSETRVEAPAAPRRWTARSIARSAATAGLAGVALGGLVGVLGAVGWAGPGAVAGLPSGVAEAATRLASALTPARLPAAAWPAAALAALGQELVFRGRLSRPHPILAGALWAASMGPAGWLPAVAAAPVLHRLARRYGVGAAALARLVALAVALGLAGVGGG